MEEKILIKSEKYVFTKVLIFLVIFGAIISVISLIAEVNDAMTIYDSYSEHQEDGECGPPWESWEECYACENMPNGLSETEYGFELVKREGEVILCFLPLIILSVISILIYCWLRGYELTITDKRIYGTVAWGKRVDLPLDSVSATATITFLKGVSVSTASGRISFLVMKNAPEIYNTINKLLVERQNKGTASTTIKQEIPQSNADELKKYKDLLDSGVISQEEFDAKKKQLLGL